MPKQHNGPIGLMGKSSMDIRSFLKVQTRDKDVKKPVKNELSDDDIIPESPDVAIKAKKKESRKKRVLSDSSDEEIFSKKPKKSRSIKDDKASQNKNKEKKPDKTALKEVKVVDMFGSAPIKRTEPLVKKEKNNPITETGIHFDDEFDESLLQLDEIADLDPIDRKNKSPAKSETDDKSKKCGKNSPIKEQSLGKETDKVKIKDEKQKEKHDKGEISLIDGKEDPDRHIKASAEKDKSKERKHKSKSHLSENENKIKESQSKSPKYNKSEIDHEKQNKGVNQKSKEHKTYDKASDKTSKNEKKRDYSEFITNDEGKMEENNFGTDGKKKKLDQSLNNSVLTDEERHERKRHSAALYQSYLNRSGPKHLGAKSIPEGTPSCLKDCAFLLTGVLESFEREEIAESITKYGGCVKNSISKKVTYVLAGDEAGPAKLSKAQELGIRIINENEFLDMIVKQSKPSDKSKTTGAKKRDKTPSSKSEKVSEERMKQFEDKVKKSFYNKSKEDCKREKSPKTERASPKAVKEDTKMEVQASRAEDDTSAKLDDTNNAQNTAAIGSLMWVDKYKPQTVKQIIGQHGDASNVKKLINWLTKWYRSRKEKTSKPSPWAKNDDGSFFKAVLLSGPPGVGKTTTVSLVCKELGFDMVEFNASDTRNKTLIRQQIGELLTTTSLSGYAKGDTSKMAVSKKHVLVMDEVDGMAGNEDRGGLQELIGLIKTTSVPIICMCNDRNSEKMRTLVNYCYDLKFTRPRVDQIKSAMLSICFKEGIKIPQNALNQLIVASNQDVRQTLNSLSMWAIQPHTDEEQLKKSASEGKKDLKLGAWEAVRKVFSAEDHKSMSINDKSDLFFYDYSMAPLFVQENYLSVQPHCPKNELLQRISKAADSISIGDLVDARIRGRQAWSLLPMQAMYSSVIPGTALSGHVAGQIQFPAWLGKNSRRNKLHRLAQEIHAHTRLSTTGSKSSIYLDYATHLRNAIVSPLVREKSEGIPQSLEALQSYSLLREDLDSLAELSLWPGQRDPMILVDSKVKAAMTRAYNKQAPALPHAAAAVAKGRKRPADDKFGDEDDDDDGDEAPEDSEPENDALIKIKKKTLPKRNDTDKPSSSKADKGKKGKGKK